MDKFQIFKTVTWWLTVGWNQQLVNISTILKLFGFLPNRRSGTRIEEEHSAISGPNNAPKNIS